MLKHYANMLIDLIRKSSEDHIWDRGRTQNCK